jgi:hypothetical protein
MNTNGKTFEVTKRLLFLANREMRRVPLDWQHPLDESGCPIPLLARDPDTVDEVDYQTPDFSDVPAEQMGICAYETTTEGTTISPVYPDTPAGRFALGRFCANNATIFADQTADVASWCRIIFGDISPVVDPIHQTVRFIKNEAETESGSTDTELSGC